MLARSLRLVVADSKRPRAAVLGSAIQPDPGRMFGWREALLGIADRLEGPAPVNPCGVARVRLLVTDGTGPLYAGGGHSLAAAVWSIADGLRMCPHDAFTASLWRGPFSAYRLDGAAGRIPDMDAVSIVLGIAMFAVLLGLIYGIDRI